MSYESMALRLYEIKREMKKLGEEAAIEKIANYGLLGNFKPQVSTTTLDALIKKRIITEEIAADIKSVAINEPIQVLREKVLEGVT